MDCASQRAADSEASCCGSSPSPAAAWAFLLQLQEATGDSECDGLAAAAAPFHADDGDAESCSGGEDQCSMELDENGLVSWEYWMTTESASVVVVVGSEAACPTSTEEDTTATAAAGDPNSDRLFWEACIAHGY